MRNTYKQGKYKYIKVKLNNKNNWKAIGIKYKSTNNSIILLIKKALHSLDNLLQLGHHSIEVSEETNLSKKSIQVSTCSIKFNK